MVHVDPIDLARMAQTTLDAAITMRESWRSIQPDLAISVSAFGVLSRARGVHPVQRAAAETAGTVVDRLVAEHERDVDRLYGAAFAYDQTDRDNAERIRSAQ